MNIESNNILEEELLTTSSNDYVYTREEVIEDYRVAYRSRVASLIGRREVLTGKAKFGIFGDGKEVAQIAQAKAFRPGDWRSGYYRDQTFGVAKGIMSFKQFFAQLYADTNLEHEPHSAGRQMNAHMASRLLDSDGNWLRQTDKFLTTSDLSPTAGQIPRIPGLALASKLYRALPELKDFTDFSIDGNEVVFGTIGNASCAEGHFWEMINAVGVLKAPLVMAIWDDGYGISVPNEYQITKANLSEVLSGFQREGDGPGYEIYTVKGWDYLALCSAFREAAELARKDHVPSIIHVTEVTQPQGHSTSGSHERYKSEERLQFEVEYDCLTKMKAWMIEEGIATDEELLIWEKEDRKLVRKYKNEAWAEYHQPIKDEVQELLSILHDIHASSKKKDPLRKLINQLKRMTEVNRSDYMKLIHSVFLQVRDEKNEAIERLKKWRNEREEDGRDYYNTYLFNNTAHSPMNIEGVAAEYSEDSLLLSGFEIVNRCFDQLFSQYPNLIAFGEDVGQLGDVNQGFAGLQAKYGKFRIMDTGIRETTIVGQAVGMALRGLRPIAEIQYLDYLLYGLETLSDDLASLAYRTRGGQKSPIIIRTRGHRLEGIWHTGSPIGMILSSLRGMHVLVPRNMTQAAGFYNTLLAGDEPAIIIEVLNGYRLKERLPDNLAEFRVPFGIPEVIREGTDLTIVTYGACCRIAQSAAKQLADCGIEVEIVDVQTLQPFDIHHKILDSIKKTNRVIFLDEDVPGGATAFMLQEVMENQKAYYYLDSEPQTITAQAHRTAYGTDGDYWCKPQVEHVFRAAYEMMNEVDPQSYPMFY